MTEAGRIVSIEQLRAIYPQPVDLIRRKVLAQLDRHCRDFIALSPLLFVSSSGPDGHCDVSPRGDVPGFVAVDDASTLLIPDRPGNNRLDTLENVLDNPHVGLLFVVPGHTHLLRINGRASIDATPSVLARFTLQNRTPLTVLRVEVQEAFMHCARAFRRGQIWDASTYPAADALPTLGQVLSDQTRPDAAEDVLLGQADRAPLY